MKILFIVKKQRFGYSGGGPSSGLYNSAKFVSDMLSEKLHQNSKLVVVTDNNDIDREVTKFRPKIVVIEALWVEPRKFQILKRLHPRVKWVVRNHSAIPFLAHEGSALGWLFKYAAIPHVEIGCNDLRTRKELEILFNAHAESCHEKVTYLPNYYPPELHRQHGHFHENHISIGCFGAIRSLKNQLIQAVGAIRYAEAHKKHLHFHINIGRLEGDGEPILRNLINLFANLKHILITHPWCHDREDFLKIVRRMDLGLQCSYSETFNIVTADFVMNDVPVVVTPEISWVHPKFYADPNSSEDIAKKIAIALAEKRKRNVERLRAYDERSIRAWKDFLSRE